jgi:hypothetical protein
MYTVTYIIGVACLLLLLTDEHTPWAWMPASIQNQHKVQVRKKKWSKCNSSLPPSKGAYAGKQRPLLH